MEIKDNWTVLQTNSLITAYRSFPNLWDPSNRYYKSKEFRRNCLKTIARQLNGIRPGTTTNDIRGKLKTLRAQYGKEKRRKELHLSRRIPGEFEPKLWCYEDIKFIDIEHRGDYISQDIEQEISIEDNMDSNETMVAEFLEPPVEKQQVVAPKKRRPPRLSNWTKEQTILLIKLLQRRPMLFDNTHPHYANFCQRAKAFHEIRQGMRDKKPEVTIPEIRSKLKTLRSQYLKEKRLMSLSNERKDRRPYEPKLWCYEYCTFLDDRGKFLEDEREAEMKMKKEKEFEAVQQPDDCYVMENENEIYVKSFDEEDIAEEDESMTQALVECDDMSNQQKSTRGLLYQKCLALVEGLTNHMPKTDENGLNTSKREGMLGKMVEIELSKVSEEIYEETKWKIINLLEEAARKDKAAKLNGYECA